MSAISQFGGRSMAFTKAHTPEILAVVGVGSVVTAGVLAARATLKLDNLVTELEMAREIIRDQEFDDEKDRAKALFKAQSKFVLGLVKLYGPATALGIAGIAALLGGQGILKKQNIALVGAYSSLDQVYREYRKRVIDEVGEEKEQEIRLNLRAVDQDESVEGDADDKPAEVLSDQHKVILGASEYAAFFDRYSSSLYSPHYDNNMSTLRIAQSHLNNRLESQGFLFLNEVWEAIGMPRTEAGQLVGWIYDPKANDGDNFVDLGLDNFENIRNGTIRNKAFTDNAILIDPNVDGVIVDKVWRKR